MGSAWEWPKGELGDRCEEVYRAAERLLEVRDLPVFEFEDLAERERDLRGAFAGLRAYLSDVRARAQERGTR
jgi:hypothetical protein